MELILISAFGTIALFLWELSAIICERWVRRTLCRDIGLPAAPRASQIDCTPTVPAIPGPEGTPPQDRRTSSGQLVCRWIFVENEPGPGEECSLSPRGSPDTICRR
jgi:hypothetical protein